VKFSDFMEAGFKLTKPGRFGFLELAPNGDLYACPIGAACYARQPQTPITGTAIAERIFPVLKERARFDLSGLTRAERVYLEVEYTGFFPGQVRTGLDGGEYLEDRLAFIIMMLRDGLEWSNEAILAWLRSQGF
jgi:hypothetical protein